MNDPNTSAHPSSSSGETPGVREAFEDLKKAVKEAWNASARQTKTTIDEAIPKTRDAFTRTVYEICYDLSYSSSYASTVVREVVPDVVSDATEKGSTAGQKAAEEFIRRRNEKKAAAERERNEPEAPEQEAGAFV